METKLLHEEFGRQLNQNFLVKVEGADPVNLQLVEVSEFTLTPRQGMFAIVFKGPSSPFLVQRTYRLENSSMGQMDLFIVAIRKDEEAVYYEAVFNRFVKQP